MQEEHICVNKLYVDVNAQFSFVRVSEAKVGDTVEFTSPGGGFVRRMSWDGFKKRFESVSESEYRMTFLAFRPVMAFFEPELGDGPNGSRVGWPALANRSCWNGWANPHFKLDTLRFMWKTAYEGKGFSSLGDICDNGNIPFFDEGADQVVYWYPQEINGELYYWVDGWCWDAIHIEDGDFKSSCFNVDEFWLCYHTVQAADQWRPVSSSELMQYTWANEDEAQETFDFGLECLFRVPRRFWQSADDMLLDDDLRRWYERWMPVYEQAAFRQFLRNYVFQWDNEMAS